MHIDFENASAAGTEGSSAAKASATDVEGVRHGGSGGGGGGGLHRLDAFALDAAALGAAADQLAGAALHVLAILFVPRGGASAAQADVAFAGAGAKRQRLPFEPSRPSTSGAGEGTLFAVVRPSPNVTLVRYTVPHETLNGAGNPLPKAQNALLAEDAENLHAILKEIFPGRWSPGSITGSSPSVG